MGVHLPMLLSGIFLILVRTSFTNQNSFKGFIVASRNGCSGYMQVFGSIMASDFLNCLIYGDLTCGINIVNSLKNSTTLGEEALPLNPRWIKFVECIKSDHALWKINYFRR